MKVRPWYVAAILVSLIGAFFLGAFVEDYATALRREEERFIKRGETTVWEVDWVSNEPLEDGIAAFDLPTGERLLFLEPECQTVLHESGPRSFCTLGITWKMGNRAWKADFKMVEVGP